MPVRKPSRQVAYDGTLLGVVALDVDGGRIVRMHDVLDPDKLGHLDEAGDLFALLAER